MKIAGREISSSQPPYIIAEISGNHAGVFDNAIKLIDAAKAADADACKLQCFEADRITLDCDKPDFILKDGPWKGRKLYDLYKATATPRAWFPDLFDHAKQVGITIFSSVFSPEDIDFLEGLDCPAYKIASFECTDTPLIEYAAKTGKPIIISTGMATTEEISDALSTGIYGPEGKSATLPRKNCAVLCCISGYPTPIEEADLRDLDSAIRSTTETAIPEASWPYLPGMPIGISDHTLGVDIPIAATALGATIIEKHLKLWDVDSEDAEFSMRETSFRDMCERIRTIWQAMQPSKRKSEKSSRQARRSLYVVENIKESEQFTSKNVRSIRPAYGMPPKELPRVLKSYAACNLERGTALEEGHLLPF